MRFLLPGLAILLATACNAGAQQYPATVEFDVVFPRNETYAPTALFPLAFAFRNSPAWIPLIPLLQWSIWTGLAGESVDGGSIDLAWGINASVDPYILTLSSLKLNTNEGQYLISWQLTYGNCTADPGTSSGISDDLHRLFFNNTSGEIHFSIREGAHSADLAADGSCPSREGFALNITTTRAVNEPVLWKDRPACGLLANLQPRPTPCALQFDAAAAASAAAELTAEACRGLHLDYTGPCPPSPTETSAGVNLSRAMPRLVFMFWASVMVALG